MATIVRRPSNAPVWVPCPGAPDLWQSVPDSESDVGREGIAAHWLGEQILTDVFHGVELVDRQAPNGVFITEEMLGHIERYVELVEGMCYAPVIEGPVDLSMIEPGHKGTSDAYGAAHDDIFTLNITDLKYGWRIVEAFENWQMLDYSAGIVAMFGPTIQKIRFIIYQPRAPHPDGPLRTWTVSLADLQNIYWPRLQKSAKGGDLHVGKHCHDCPGRMACGALREAVASASEYVTSPVVEIYDGLTLATELHMLESAEIALNARIETIREMAMDRIKAQPNSVPGWDIDRNSGREKWSTNTDLETLESLTGLSLHKPKPLSPNQARDAGLSDTIVNRYSERALGSPKLVKHNSAKALKRMKPNVKNQ